MFNWVQTCNWNIQWLWTALMCSALDLSFLPTISEMLPQLVFLWLTHTPDCCSGTWAGHQVSTSLSNTENNNIRWWKRSSDDLDQQPRGRKRVRESVQVTISWSTHHHRAIRQIRMVVNRWNTCFDSTNTSDNRKRANAQVCFRAKPLDWTFCIWPPISIHHHFMLPGFHNK